MENLTLDEIVDAINGNILYQGGNRVFSNISTDSRKIEENSIFIALKGDNFNANELVIDAIDKGASLCIIDEVKFDLKSLNDVKSSVIIVEDSRKALLDLAKYYRKTLDIKIIGITGSTGKTSTKDLVAAALSSKYKVFKTKGNFNNEIGLPLMIFNLDRSYDIAVLEMGMSNLGEIHRLADVARPDIAIITNIGISHIENLETRENILKAKMEITDFFDKNSILILNSDNDMLANLFSDRFKVIKVAMENTILGSDYKASNVVLEEESISFNVNDKSDKQALDFILDMPGKHNVLNCILAIATAKELGMDYVDIKEGIKALEPTSMRLDIIKGERFTVINDCYNASPDSTKAAIEVLKNLNGKRKIAILGTMKELGEESYRAHKEIGEFLYANKIDILLCLGEFSEGYVDGFNNIQECIKFNSQEELLQHLAHTILKDDVVLVKASRTMKFEKIVEFLEKINC